MQTTNSVTPERAIPDGFEKPLYTAKTVTTGGREGASQSSDGRLDVKLSTPGGPGAGTNPEQLLAAGWSACFIGALGKAAGQHKMRLSPETSINTEIDLCSGEDGYFLQARLYISLPEIDARIAQSLIEAAKATCPYSKATQGNIKTAYFLV
ncbi:MAG: organic hydroperoxide resistance protein [Bacteroidota bacterium]